MKHSSRWEEWTALMRMAVDGDEIAYRRLLNALTPALRSAARRGVVRVGGDLNDVEDVVQEVLLAIHLKRHTWKPDTSIGPWVTAIVRNKVVDALRRRGHRIQISIEDVIGSLQEESTDDTLDRQDVDRMLNRLDGREEDIIRSISIYGYSARETAERLNMTEGSVRVALHRGLRKLAAIYRRRRDEN